MLKKIATRSKHLVPLKSMRTDIWKRNKTICASTRISKISSNYINHLENGLRPMYFPQRSRSGYHFFSALRDVCLMLELLNPAFSVHWAPGSCSYLLGHAAKHKRNTMYRKLIPNIKLNDTCKEHIAHSPKCKIIQDIEEITRTRSNQQKQ